MAAAKAPEEDAESQYLLGYMYEDSPFEAGAVGSTSISHHDGKAAKWFHRAAEQVLLLIQWYAATGSFLIKMYRV